MSRRFSRWCNAEWIAITAGYGIDWIGMFIDEVTAPVEQLSVKIELQSEVCHYSARPNATGGCNAVYLPHQMSLIGINNVKKQYTSGDDDHQSEGRHGTVKTILFAMVIFLNLPFTALAIDYLPVETGVITSGVGLRVDPFGSGKLVFHRGIDIAVPVGTPVRAVRKGRVVFAGARSGYGSTVVVEHANGDRTLYGHNSLVRVRTGDLVESGTVVAFSGNTGRSTGPHVHFEQLPSGRPVMEIEETEETTLPQVAGNDDQRYLLEQKMEESVNSILRTINRVSTAGQGG